jgi:hypothetical protein
MLRAGGLEVGALQVAKDVLNALHLDAKSDPEILESFKKMVAF